MPRVLVTYDISDDKVRLKSDKCLKGYLYRVQRSVFEGVLTENSFNELLYRLQKFTLSEHDSLRIYRICERCSAQINILGSGEVIQKKDYLII